MKTWIQSKNETEVISDPSWMNSDPHFTLPSREPADLHAIVCVHDPFTLFYPMNRQTFQQTAGTDMSIDTIMTLVDLAWSRTFNFEMYTKLSRTDWPWALHRPRL